MLFPTISEIQPYATLIGTMINLVALGFIVNLANLIRNAAKDKIEILEARNKAVQEEREAKEKLLEARINILETQNKTVQADLDRTEKWHTRKVEELTKEVDGYKAKLGTSLSEAGISFESLLLGHQPTSLAKEVKQSLQDMQEALRRFTSEDGARMQANPEWYLEMGKGYMAAGEWRKAAIHFDKYIQYDSTNWEVHFSRAVSYANTRSGVETNIQALRAYNDAITYAPSWDESTDIDLLARLFAYRGAMWKRLNRTEEALADLNIAKQYTTADYEMADIKYNLACIYAMKGQKVELLEMVKSIKSQKYSLNYLSAIKSHLGDYFALFASDEDFLQAINI